MGLLRLLLSLRTAHSTEKRAEQIAASLLLGLLRGLGLRTAHSTEKRAEQIAASLLLGLLLGLGLRTAQSTKQGVKQIASPLRLRLIAGLLRHVAEQRTYQIIRLGGSWLLGLGLRLRLGASTKTAK